MPQKRDSAAEVRELEPYVWTTIKGAREDETECGTRSLERQLKNPWGIGIRRQPLGKRWVHKDVCVPALQLIQEWREIRIAHVLAAYTRVQRYAVEAQNVECVGEFSECGIDIRQWKRSEPTEAASVRFDDLGCGLIHYSRQLVGLGLVSEVHPGCSRENGNVYLIPGQRRTCVLNRPLRHGRADGVSTQSLVMRGR
jgi:hypothetical protein